MRECIAQKVNLAALPRAAEDLSGRSFEALVRVGDHELHPTQPSARERAQKARPERLRFRRSDLKPKNLVHAVGVHTHGDYYGDRHNPPGLAHLQVRRIDPQVRPVALDRTIEKRTHPLVDLPTQPRDLALADAAHAKGFHELVHRARRDEYAQF